MKPRTWAVGLLFFSLLVAGVSLAADAVRVPASTRVRTTVASDMFFLCNAVTGNGACDTITLKNVPDKMLLAVSDETNCSDYTVQFTHSAFTGAVAHTIDQTLVFGSGGVLVWNNPSLPVVSAVVSNFADCDGLTVIVEVIYDDQFK